MAGLRALQVAPSAARLTGSLRDIGYDFTTAIADLVDNSIAAGASRINVFTQFVPHDSYVLISDDGRGMSQGELVEALRFGTRRDYKKNELGRFGLGLKTGSFSQCRRLTVVSRTAPTLARFQVMTLDLNRIATTDSWDITVDETSPAIERAKDLLRESPGTVVVWEDLDRVLPERYAETGWGRRRLSSLASRTADHLAMVFHRFIAGEVGRGDPVVICVDDAKLEAWDPFAPHERERTVLPEQIFEVENGSGSSEVRFQGVVLPARDRFSSLEQFERLSGPQKWNRQQGLYIYRADRLVQHGGWSGLRGIDEHTKLARASLDFGTDLDEDFQINVAKMHVALPPMVRQMLERPIHELCVLADDAYRRSANTTARAEATPKGSRASDMALRDIGVALKAALIDDRELGDYSSVLHLLRARHPELADQLSL
ncbi:ATP-binding protein [Phycicoccus duodecadis]|uniref:Histidine kinase/DNA gyrase B/HSP90-like ATPase n=1 Tax=Phycicoccus duodecadis TaxID=173053 RepID=A0A2N3YMA8_9MICO|nr:ATP-binding protein [Phycicoccus duodecadis]PKW27982.1 histidine kinase/DNA gyrase B/HSP90-like ATPase [Phycicoccus duodecadis]